MNTFNRHFLTASITLAHLTGAAQAATINWGGAFFTSNYSADGTGLEVGATEAAPTGGVLYELGVFQNTDGSEFTPTFENAEDWSDRWVPFAANDNSVTSASSAYDSATSNYFGNIVVTGDDPTQVSTVTSSVTGGNLVAGFQAYIWGYDTKVLDGVVEPEWFLVTGKTAGVSNPTTSNWVVPDSNASNNASFDIQWEIASASEAIVGQIDNNRGGGEMVDPIGPFGESDHQFATIPEPSSALLACLAGLALLRRRR